MADETDAAVAPRPLRAHTRVRHGMRRGHNWVQLAKFCAVGATGYGINLFVYWLLISGGVHYLAAAVWSAIRATSRPVRRYPFGARSWEEGSLG